MVGWCALALAAYGVFLAATAPSRIVGRFVDLPPAVSHLSGTVWKGEAVLANRLVADWRVDPSASLGARALRLGWSMAGSDTRLTGTASIAPDGAVSVTGISGVAGWSLVEAALTGVPFRCDPRARVDIAEIAVADGQFRAEGRMTTGPGQCADDIGAVAVPALDAEVENVDGGVRLLVRLNERPDTVLGEAVVTAAGDLIITIQPAGAALVPGMPTSAASVIEMPLAFKAQPPPDR